MGRSRAVRHSADDGPCQSRGAKRKKTASSIDNLETSAGQGVNEGKGAFYHCNYCNKNISGKIRIKCVMCPDFDLCVECFSVGVEVTPHKSNHAYRVMDNLSFPLICPEWNADEETLLLEGIEMYGMGNWNEVSEHVGTKSKTQCIDHYNSIYMNSPFFPLPDLSHVVGKTREELLAMAKERSEVKKEFPVLGELTIKEESPLSARIKTEEGAACRSSSTLIADVSPDMSSISHNTSTGAMKKSSGMAQVKDDRVDMKVEEPLADRSVGGKKLRTSWDEEHSLKELSGYNPKRQEFDIEYEYDKDAEQLLADMEFKDTDSEAERQLKLRVLHIYSKRLDERKRRKDFVLERNLLYPNALEKNLSDEEREICKPYKVFMRFYSKEEHENFLNNIIEEHRIRKRIQDLQEAREAGCCTSAEAERYIEQKRKKEAEERARTAKESALLCPGGKVSQKANLFKGETDNSSPRGAVKGSDGPQNDSKGSSATTAGAAFAASSLDKWDITGLFGADLLSENEKQLCGEIRLLPAHYLKMLQTLSTEMLSGNLSNKRDAHRLFKVEPSKVDQVYDMLIKKGIVQP